MKHSEAEEGFYDTIIIGGGVSGLAAAIYTGRFNMKTAVVAENLGGTIILTGDIENYPGFEKITGMDLADKFIKHAKNYNVEFISKKVTKIDHCDEGCFIVHIGDEHKHAKTVIYSAGTEWKKLNVPGEKEYTGKGVHYCALCDGTFYKDKTVAVVGGSDSAAKEALLLTEYAKKVYIIYRKEKIRAEPINADRVDKNEKIEIIPTTNVAEVKGDKFVNSVVLDKPYKGSKEFKLDALFVEIGHLPLSKIAADIGVKLNEKNEIIIDKDAKTNVQGVFAAGDVCDSTFKQAVTGVAEGVKAAYSVYHHINTNVISFCGECD